MTSRSYAKNFNRKINSNVTPGSIQFDKLFRENSNRPSAAKSAGTVGKWGITSFTSIRSTNINGRCSNDIRANHGIKRMKIDYGNQNSHEKYVYSYKKSEETKLDIGKPKKFFKSRNMMTVTEESKSNADICQLKTNTFSDQEQNQEIQPYESTAVNEKISEDNFNAFGEASSRGEGKPPIVLRICKGTAKLICSEEADIESYKISSTSPIFKGNVDRKVISQNIRSEKAFRINNRESSISTSASNPNDKIEMRTTRSRAKNVRPEPATSSDAISSHSPNPGLSLTLRKSLNDSNKTNVSHYDIVKADYAAGPSNKSTDPIIKSDELLKSSTQELIDILSCDLDPIQNKSIDSCDQTIEKEPNFIEEKALIKNNVRKSHINDSELDVYQNEHTHERNDDIVIDEHIKDTVSCRTDSSILTRNTKDSVVKILDQDWFSSSDDSESASGNLQSETLGESQCLLSHSDLSTATLDETVNKPTMIKKGSIFKTRASSKDGNKRRALYKHKWCDNDKELKSSGIGNERNINSDTPIKTLIDHNIVTFDGEFENDPLTRIVTYTEAGLDLPIDVDNAVTSIRCGRKIKGFYTVVKNVKKAHQIQESGEFQEFNDDVEYILDTLRENNPNATRCLSAIRLASKCMAPAFRMHVRAHGTVAKFFKALHDATTDQSLALCTATVMFVLSQDRLAMDLDRDCLELMLSLLESEASHKNALDDCGLSRVELLKNKEKVRQLCADIQAQGHAKHLNLDNITVGHLAMETLLSLTSRRAGEWFKEELRELGGLEHIVKTITECYRHIDCTDISHDGWSELLLDKLRKVDRCLRVLENVTHMNEENQVYLLKYSNSILVITLSHLYNLCGREVLKYPTTDSNDKSSKGAVIRECLFAVIKVLINLTHRFNKQSFGGRTVGFQDRVIDNSLHLILRVPQVLPEDKRFDITMLALILLINLIEQCEDNKKSLIESRSFAVNEGQDSGLCALINLFYKQEELARAEEQKTDAILDGQKDSEQSETIVTTSKSQEEFIEETVAKLLQKAGRHMEHTLIGAYVVLLIGYLIMDNKVYENLVRNRLPDGTFATMVSVLQKFFNFMNLTASNEISSCGIAATENIIKFLKMSDARLTEGKIDLKLALEDMNNTIDRIA